MHRSPCTNVIYSMWHIKARQVMSALTVLHITLPLPPCHPSVPVRWRCWVRIVSMSFGGWPHVSCVGPWFYDWNLSLTYTGMLEVVKQYLGILINTVRYLETFFKCLLFWKREVQILKQTCTVVWTWILNGDKLWLWLYVIACFRIVWIFLLPAFYILFSNKCYRQDMFWRIPLFIFTISCTAVWLRSPTLPVCWI